MEDKCIIDLQRDCIGLAEATLLKKRIELLEEWKEKSSKFQEDFYKYQRIQIERDARLDERLINMDNNLRKVVEWQEDQQKKPAKRWESVADKVLMMVVGAVVAFVLTKIGLQ